ncbi:MAG: hypothetical protein F4X72_08140 [Dehalococcoidia bacterium]|nr:hypothetical protein [Dehalococcoidia bacterium]
MSQDEEPTEVIITGIEIPTDELVWLVAKIMVIAAAVAIPLYLIGLAVFVLVSVVVSFMSGAL